MLLAVLGWSAMRNGVDAVSRPPRPLTASNLFTAGAGVALLAWGIVTFDWPLVLSGLPLLALGAGLIVTRHLLGRRTSTD
jgi:hypothetical protein